MQPIAWITAVFVSNLHWQLEGEEVAAWLNSIGVTGIILNYQGGWASRLPGNVDRRSIAKVAPDVITQAI